MREMTLERMSGGSLCPAHRQNLAVVEIRPRNPLEHHPRSEAPPTHNYYVDFWRQPLTKAREIPDIQSNNVGWSSTEYDVLGADDVHEVIAWADGQARERDAMYTLYAVSYRQGDEGLVWLAGVDPTQPQTRHFKRRQPPEVDPVF